MINPRPAMANTAIVLAIVAEWGMAVRPFLGDVLRRRWVS